MILESWTRSATVSAGQVRRARILLAVADGASSTAAAVRLGVSRPTVIKWCDRYARQGIAGLADEPRRGRPKIVEDGMIISRTLEPPPERLGVTHWSSRLLGKDLGVGNATVARAWRRHGGATLVPDKIEPLRRRVDRTLPFASGSGSLGRKLGAAHRKKELTGVSGLLPDVPYATHTSR